MTRIKVKELIFDKWNIEHIKKHNISKKEIREICRGKYRQQPTYRDRYLIFGKTDEGKLVTIVLGKKRRGTYYVVTARSMSKKERKQFINDN